MRCNADIFEVTATARAPNIEQIVGSSGFFPLRPPECTCLSLSHSRVAGAPCSNSANIYSTSSAASSLTVPDAHGDELLVVKVT